MQNNNLDKISLAIESNYSKGGYSKLSFALADIKYENLFPKLTI